VTLEALLLQRCNVITSCVLVRASALFEVGLFDVALRRGQDYDLWLRMAEHGCRFAYDRTVRVERTERSWGSPEESIADVERLLSVRRAGAVSRLSRACSSPWTSCWSSC